MSYTQIKTSFGCGTNSPSYQTVDLSPADQAQLQKPWRKRWWMMGFGIFFYLLICGVTVLSFIPLIDSWKYFSLRRSDPFLILIPAALVLLVLYMTWYLIKTPKGWRDFRAAMTSHKKTIVSGVLSDLTVGDRSEEHT